MPWKYVAINYRSFLIKSACNETESLAADYTKRITEQWNVGTDKQSPTEFHRNWCLGRGAMDLPSLRDFPEGCLLFEGTPSP